jgi:tetratricopeptide (TPR) repeat protein
MIEVNTKSLTSAYAEHRSGDFARAEQSYRQLIRANVKDPAAYAGLCQLYIQQNRLDPAKRILEDAYAANLANADLYALEGDLYFRAAQWQNALQAFQQAINYDPNHYGAYLATGRVLLVTQEFTAAEQNFRLALRANPDGVDAMALLSLALIELGRSEEALKNAQIAADLAPDNANAQFALGRAFIDRGHRHFGLRALQNALKLNPQLHQARLLIATCMAEDGHYEVALDLAELMVRERMYYYEARWLAARVAYAMQDPKRSLLHLAEVHGNAEVTQRVAQLRAACHLSMGDGEACLRELPDDPNEPFDAAMLRADAHRQLGAQDLAWQSYRQAAERFPDRHEPILPLCQFAEQDDRYADVRMWAERGKKIAPSIPDFDLLLASAAFADGDHSSTLRTLKQVDEHSLNGISRQRLHRLRGFTEEALGHRNEALLQFTQARLAVLESPAAVPEIAPEVLGQFIRKVASTRGTPLRFLFGLPGSAVEALALLVTQHHATELLTDRLFSNTPRKDRFFQAITKVLTPLDDSERAAAQQQYLELRSTVTDRPQVVDMLPGTAQCLAVVFELFPDAEVLLVDRDPRDLLLDVLTYGQRSLPMPITAPGAAAHLRQSLKALSAIKLRVGTRLNVLKGFQPEDPAWWPQVRSFLQLPEETPIPKQLAQKRIGQPYPWRRAEGQYQEFQTELASAFAGLG